MLAPISVPASSWGSLQLHAQNWVGVVISALSKPSLQPVLTIFELLVPMITLAGGWMKWREGQLRRDDVLAWANEGIAAMETLLLICKWGEQYDASNELDKKLKELCITTAILTERGRLFFKNQSPTLRGQKKEPAYRGDRPCILDQLVVANKVALRWRLGNAEDRARMTCVAETALKKFVSLVQKEVGRNRTAAGETKRSGEKIDLDVLMDEVDEVRLRKFLGRKPDN